MMYAFFHTDIRTGRGGRSQRLLWYLRSIVCVHAVSLPDPGTRCLSGFSRQSFPGSNKNVLRADPLTFDHFVLFGYDCRKGKTRPISLQYSLPGS
jgi:hypothetical protein